MNENQSLSNRGSYASKTALRVDFELYFEACQNLYHKENNPNGTFPLNVAENRLCWNLFRDKITELSRLNTIPDWVSGYTSALGAPDFRKSLSAFLEKFITNCSIDPNHIGVSSGATGVIEMTSFILGNSDDVAVIPAPSYPVYKNDIGNKAGMERYDLITHHDYTNISSGSPLALYHLDQTLNEIEQKGKKFRMLIITNPDNPTGWMYSYDKLLEIADWCIQHSVHFIVNEIYSLSLINIQHPDLIHEYTHESKYCSFAKIMQEKGSDYLHMWYSLSKDFGISGFRVGLVYSQNKEFIKGYENFNGPHMVSNHTQWLLQLLFEDHNFISTYIIENQFRLTESYLVVVQMLKKLNIRYVPSRGSLFVWVDLSEFLSENSQESETKFWLELYHETAILLTPGNGFGNTKKGLFRVVYTSITKAELIVAFNRFSNFIKSKRAMA